ncbi:MAG: hypothetical protein ACLGJB_03835 [Blastocatellia bacterium]
MPSKSFTIQKLIGREFEQAMIPVLSEMGFRIIDTDSWAYRHKKGVDVIVDIKGVRCALEFKLDKLSERTQHVCIDLDSIQKTTSAIWIFGLPRTPYIDCYATKIADLAPFTYQYAKDNPGAVKRVGEFKQECVMIPKYIFTRLPFISKFKTIELQPN